MYMFVIPTGDDHQNQTSCSYLANLMILNIGSNVIRKGQIGAEWDFVLYINACIE